MACITLSACAPRGIMLMQTTKQKVWHIAKQHQLDDFVVKVAKTFPDALEIVHVQTRNENAWCYAGNRDNDGVQ
ncbi:hypothetical protein KGB37_gp54 [Escherichia phage vB_EcoS Sa179lw]|uniref:Uncharacterized protein n=1 Tax=Escherichia phage vB_EcoS Sa179lw TaxID=2126819 RepID=A0A2P1MXD6_9CAUD|nr:hypothetical protein KGB37_gp54 [Escherichia phage vB_EcoS Sa179lw]AVP40239.1 hypothetical protein vBEcoSSa179w3YLVW_00054 [Escherichia phage vB_EcoS Sa179lw]